MHGLFRNPSRVKEILRPVRVALGPTSILTSMYVSSMQLFHAFANSCLWLTLTYGLVLVATFMAGVVMRPDNQEMTRILGLKMNIKAIHGVLLLFSHRMSTC